MRKFILGTLLLACVCAVPQKHDLHVTVDKVEYSNLPKNFKLYLNPIQKKLLDHPHNKSPRDLEATVNDFADRLFKNIRIFMINAGLDPFAMPDMHSGLNYTLIITYHGDLDLTNGQLTNLDSLRREGDVVVHYSTDEKYLEVTVPIGFGDLAFTYDYHASIMGLGPSGAIEGKVNGITVEVKVGFDVDTLELSLAEFYITNSGSITFHFTGNVLVDWLLNILTDVINTLLKEVILLIIESVIRGTLESVIDSVNSALGGLFNPTTPAPTTESLQLFNALLDLRK